MGGFYANHEELTHSAAREDDPAIRSCMKVLVRILGMAEESQYQGFSPDLYLQKVAQLLQGCLPDSTASSVSIRFDGSIFICGSCQSPAGSLHADITINGISRGGVEVTTAAAEAERGTESASGAGRIIAEAIAGVISLTLSYLEVQRDRRQLQEQLRHADRLATIGQLAAGAAHELNEPLGNVLGFAQLAKASPSLPLQTEQDIEKIVNAALHAREIIKKMMSFSRQMPARKAPCNLNDLVREGLYFLESRCAREGIQVVRELQGGLPEVAADAAQLHQVLVNLAVNAIQAMTHGGTLTIRTRGRGDRVVLVVEDTGTGMTEEVLKQLFTPFFTTKGIGQGTGLGLTVVQNIVKSHSGTIRVASRPGQGSCFEISLPADLSKEND